MLFSVFLLYLYYENNVYIFTFSDVHIHIHGGIVKDSTAIARIFCLIKEDKTLHLLKITNSFLFNFQYAVHRRWRGWGSCFDFSENGG